MNTMTLVVLIILLVFFVAPGVAPMWPHTREWGYYPISGVGLVVLILVILLLTGRL